MEAAMARKLAKDDALALIDGSADGSWRCLQEEGIL
jgi:hypothetical protein